MAWSEWQPGFNYGTVSTRGGNGRWSFTRHYSSALTHTLPTSADLGAIMEAQRQAINTWTADTDGSALSPDWQITQEINSPPLTGVSWSGQTAKGGTETVRAQIDFAEISTFGVDGYDPSLASPASWAAPDITTQKPSALLPAGNGLIEGRDFTAIPGSSNYIEYLPGAGITTAWRDKPLNINWATVESDNAFTGSPSSPITVEPFRMEVYYGGLPASGPLDPYFRYGTGSFLQEFATNPLDHGWTPDVTSPPWWFEQVTLRISAINQTRFVLYLMPDFFGSRHLLFTDYPPGGSSFAPHEQHFGFFAHFYTPDEEGAASFGFGWFLLDYFTPPWRYWSGQPHLRLTQRNDGLGSARNPRLLSSPGNAPSSVQRTAAPRLGTNDRYR